jgi:hypothetical protein
MDGKLISTAKTPLLKPGLPVEDGGRKTTPADEKRSAFQIAIVAVPNLGPRGPMSELH